MNAIETQGLSKAYGGAPALQDLNLQVRRNSIVGFLGPNGAGKSTTIKLLLGLMRPTAGRGAVFGHDIVTESLKIRQRVGFLAQEPRFYEHLTARETLRFAARFFYTGPSAAMEARVSASLELVGLQDKADRPVKGFSGGERQRLGIAQAQINDPELIILDEPAAALDPMGRRDVLAIMTRLRERSTIFYSTHILDDVQRVSDAVAILNRGRLVAQAPIGDLLAGNGRTAYLVTLKGAAAAARKRLTEQPWVTGVEEAAAAGQTRLTVTVTDESVAEALLLRVLLSDADTVVTAFGRRKFDLEEIFLGLVEGGRKHEH